jgi:hypothetical protein
MSSAYMAVTVFLLAALVILIILWAYARSVKKDLATPPTLSAQARGVIDLAPSSAKQIHEMSEEPVLLKQTEEGIRVQVDRRPMQPLMTLAGTEVSRALNEAAAEVSERYGMTWVVLLSAAEDGRVTVQRLS